MTTAGKDYFRYFPRDAIASAWGLSLTASGHTRILPGTEYPPVRHPSDHHFDWNQGRTLKALQLVLITEGAGVLETNSLHLAIKAGQAFLVLPGVWHRYRPDPAIGWVESWMEVDGPVVRNLFKAGILSQREMVRGGHAVAEVEAALDALHTRASATDMGADPALAAASYAVLAAWDKLGRPHAQVLSRVQKSVLEAEHFIHAHGAESISVAALAKQFGVAYSQFRHAFKEHTGLAPWQYVLRLRLAKARQALANDEEAKLEEIAQRFGFSSAFHLSAAFRRFYGISPSAWRRQLLEASRLKPHPRSEAGRVR